MITVVAGLLAATLLTDLDDETPEMRSRQAAEVAAETLAATNAPASATGKTVMITSDHADYDRRDGVIFFNENVHVSDPEFDMHSDKLHVFVNQLNQLKRIVVTGHVVITNGTKNGACSRATFVKDLHRIIMFGTPDFPARLVDDSKKRSVVEGTKITFWTDSEQVEVDTPTITLDGGLPTGDLKDVARDNGQATTNLTPKTEKKEEKESSR